LESLKFISVEMSEDNLCDVGELSEEESITAKKVCSLWK